MGKPRKKVLIVDDEQIIRDGLRDFIDWEAEGFTFIEAARSADEAMELVGRFEPELVITDISMPDSDGLELAALIKRKAPETIIVILSGYSEFGYAQRAIELGVFRYLSKPVREGELKELLAEARAAIARREDGRERRSLLLTQLAGHRELFQDSFFAELRRGAATEQDVSEARKHLNFPAEGKLYAVAVICIDPSPGAASAAGSIGRQADILSLRTAAEQVFHAREIQCGAFRIGEDRIALLCTFAQASAADAVDAIQLATQDLQLKAARELGLGFCAGVGEPVNSLQGIPECCAQAEHALDYRLAAGRNSLIFWADVADRERRPAFPASGRSERLVQSIRAGNRQLAQSVIEESFAALRATGGCDNQTVQVYVASLVHPVVGILLEMGYRLEEVFGEGANPYRGLYRCSALADLEAWVKRLCASIADFLAGRAGSAQRLLAGRARKYIDEHFCSEDLNLPRISRALQVSQAYVSHVFKIVLGINMSDYLSRSRIEYAKQLLRTSSQKMFEIAEECGFRDTNYFSTLFKRLVGVSPSDYREKANFDIP